MCDVEGDVTCDVARDVECDAARDVTCDVARDVECDVARDVAQQIVILQKVETTSTFSTTRKFVACLDATSGLQPATQRATSELQPATQRSCAILLLVLLRPYVRSQSFLKS